jgi:Na+/H+-translocating membrane pyrophosphatase
VAIVAVVVVVLLKLGKFDNQTIVAFLVGAILSAVAGFVGMHISRYKVVCWPNAKC